MTPLRSFTLIFLILCAFASSHTAQGKLKCYHCDDFKGDDCMKDGKVYPDKIKTCVNDQETRCFAQNVKDQSVRKQAGGCAPSSTNEGCIETTKKIQVETDKREDKILKICFCNGHDGCNIDNINKNSGSNKLGGFSVWPLAALTSLLIYLEVGFPSA